MKSKYWYAFGLLWVLASLSALYSVFTGDAIGNDTHYDTTGRIINAAVFLFFVGWGVYMLRTMRDTKKLLEKDETVPNKGGLK